mgnify:CR=1 FL=1
MRNLFENWRRFVNEVKKLVCPPATQDLELNTKNRDATIKQFNYGPLNVNEPGDYWKKIAKYWKTSEEAAKQSLCGNCVAFDISPRMDDCMPGETSDDDGRLGYCWMHHFKCHSARSCHTWAKGGPITKDEKSLKNCLRKIKKINHSVMIIIKISKSNVRSKRVSLKPEFIKKRFMSSLKETQ